MRMIRIFCIVVCMLLPMIAFADVESTYICAENLLAQKNYLEAAALYDSIISYQDAAKCGMYAKACEAMNRGDYENSIAAFKYLGQFKDCDLLVEYCEALNYEANEQYEKALEAYSQLPLLYYRDSQERVEQIENIFKSHNYSYVWECVGEYIVVEKDDKCGIINKYGNSIVLCEWDDIFLWSRDEKSKIAMDNDKNVHVFEDEEVFENYIEKDGLELIDNILGFCSNDSDGGMKSFFVTLDNRYIEFNESHTIFHEKPKIEEIKIDLTVFENNEKFGYINANGEVVIPCEWDDAKVFDNGIAKVRLEDKWGCIDTTGKIVVECIWDYVGDYTDGGLISVFKGTLNSRGLPDEGEYTIIDIKNKVIWEKKWDYLRFVDEEHIVVEENNRMGILDREGNVVVPCRYRGIDYFSMFTDGFVKVSDEKFNKGFIDLEGNVVIPCEYDSAEYGDGYFVLIQDEVYEDTPYLKIVDVEGNTIF